MDWSHLGPIINVFSVSEIQIQNLGIAKTTGAPSENQFAKTDWSPWSTGSESFWTRRSGSLCWRLAWTPSAAAAAAANSETEELDAQNTGVHLFIFLLLLALLSLVTHSQAFPDNNLVPVVPHPETLALFQPQQTSISYLAERPTGWGVGQSGPQPVTGQAEVRRETNIYVQKHLFSERNN